VDLDVSFSTWTDAGNGWAPWRDAEPLVTLNGWDGTAVVAGETRDRAWRLVRDPGVDSLPECILRLPDGREGRICVVSWESTATYDEPRQSLIIFSGVGPWPGE
jgi:hypothetical protein